MRIIYIITTFILLSYTLIQAESETNAKLGLFGMYGFNQHSTSFSNLPNIPNCCPEFQNGSGNGLNLGLSYERKLHPKWWIGARVGLFQLDGTLSEIEGTPVVYNGQIYDGKFEHSIQSKINLLAIEPHISYNAFSDFFINFGFRTGMNISDSYSQKEQIVDPKNAGTFLDENGNNTFSRIRNKFSGSIPNSASLQYGIIGGINYELSINSNRTLILAPEVQFYYSLSDIINNIDWRANSISAGLALKYRILEDIKKKESKIQRFELDTIAIISEDIESKIIKIGLSNSSFGILENDNEIIEIETISRTDTLFVPVQYSFDNKIEIFGMDSNGKIYNQPDFEVVEFVSNRLDPLLNYIFFEENTSEIPVRYKLLSNSEAKVFDEQSLDTLSTLEIYYNILNIVGSRLQRMSNTNLRILGCNADMGSETSNTILSLNRANSIKEYLINSWDIDPNKIIVSTRNLPEKASYPKNDLSKMAENRRIEMYSNNAELFKPLFINKTETVMRPEILRVNTGLEGQNKTIYKTDLKISQNSREEETLVYSKSDLQDYTIDIDLNLQTFQMPDFKIPLDISLDIIDIKGNLHKLNKQSNAIKFVSAKQKTSNIGENFEVEKFSLILFDFDKAEISKENGEIIEFIKNRIKPNSNIEIFGHTDQIGNEQYNIKLSERRAIAVQKLLNQENVKLFSIGGNQELFDNSLPEGRFYSRTVTIVVKTKVED